MPRNTTLITAAVILLVCVTSSRGQDTGKVQFRLGLEKGQSFSSKTLTQQLITQTIAGQAIEADTAVGTTYKFEVQGIAADGAATLKVTVEGMSMSLDVPGLKVDYDSTNPQDPVPSQARAAAAMVGKSFIMKMNSLGEVVQVEGVESILEAVLAEAGDATIQKQVEKQFGGNAMVATMQGMLAPYPDKPVVIGESWSKTTNVARGFPMQIDSTYTLKERADGMATLAVESTIKSDPRPVGTGPARATVEISGKRTGEMVVHETTGWTMSSKLAMDFKGSRKISGPMEMTIPLTVTGQMTVKTTE